MSKANPTDAMTQINHSVRFIWISDVYGSEIVAWDVNSSAWRGGVSGDLHCRQTWRVGLHPKGLRLHEATRCNWLDAERGNL